MPCLPSAAAASAARGLVQRDRYGRRAGAAGEIRSRQTRTPGMRAHRIVVVLRQFMLVAPMPVMASTMRSRSVAPLPQLAMYSTAARTPWIAAWFSVPVSMR